MKENRKIGAPKRFKDLRKCSVCLPRKMVDYLISLGSPLGLSEGVRRATACHMQDRKK